MDRWGGFMWSITLKTEERMCKLSSGITVYCRCPFFMYTRIFSDLSKLRTHRKMHVFDPVTYVFEEIFTLTYHIMRHRSQRSMYPIWHTWRDEVKIMVYAETSEESKKGQTGRQFWQGTESVEQKGETGNSALGTNLAHAGRTTSWTEMNKCRMRSLDVSKLDLTGQQYNEIKIFAMSPVFHGQLCSLNKIICKMSRKRACQTKSKIIAFHVYFNIL